MLELLEEYDVLIFGRKTWDNILSWDIRYLQDLEKVKIIILSSKMNGNNNEFSNVIYCNCIEDCLNTCEKLKYDRIFISGGAMINNSFMEMGIVDEIILNYNPFILNKGIPLFSGNYFENQDIVQVHYKVINE